MRPWAARISSTRAVAALGSLTSTERYSARPPADSMLRKVERTAAWRSSELITFST